MSRTDTITRGKNKRNKNNTSIAAHTLSQEKVPTSRPEWHPRSQGGNEEVNSALIKYRKNARSALISVLNAYFERTGMSKSEAAQKLNIVPSGVSRLLSEVPPYDKDPVSLDQLGRLAFGLIKKPITIKIYPGKSCKVEIRSE